MMLAQALLGHHMLPSHCACLCLDARAQARAIDLKMPCSGLGNWIPILFAAATASLHIQCKSCFMLWTIHSSSFDK